MPAKVDVTFRVRAPFGDAAEDVDRQDAGHGVRGKHPADPGQRFPLGDGRHDCTIARR